MLEIVFSAFLVIFVSLNTWSAKEAYDRCVEGDRIEIFEDNISRLEFYFVSVFAYPGAKIGCFLGGEADGKQ